MSKSHSKTYIIQQRISSAELKVVWRNNKCLLAQWISFIFSIWCINTRCIMTVGYRVKSKKYFNEILHHLFHLTVWLNMTTDDYYLNHSSCCCVVSHFVFNFQSEKKRCDANICRQPLLLSQGHFLRWQFNFRATWAVFSGCLITIIIFANMFNVHFMDSYYNPNGFKMLFSGYLHYKLPLMVSEIEYNYNNGFSGIWMRFSFKWEWENFLNTVILNSFPFILIFCSHFKMKTICFFFSLTNFSY